MSYGLKSKQIEIESPRVKEAYEACLKTPADREDSFSQLIDILNKEGEIARLSEKAELRYLLDSSDFYRCLNSTMIIPVDGEFIINDASVSKYPPYPESDKYSFTPENIRNAFLDNFTPQMFKDGILRYLPVLDKCIHGREDPRKFDRPLKKEVLIEYAGIIEK